MCTAIALKTAKNHNFLGRNMDFSHDLDPHLFIVPRHCVWESAADGQPLTTSYQFIGIGQRLAGLLAFFDGVNETGFAAAALYFSGYASYDALYGRAGKKRLAAFDLLTYLLGNCASAADVRRAVRDISLVGVADPVTGAAAPLHWLASDRGGRCVVVEKTERGFEVFDNDIGVLANAPDFPWHRTNLNNYAAVTSVQRDSARWGGVTLTAPSQAGGTLGLPGGFASPERFVRTAFIKTHADPPRNDDEAVGLGFQCLKSVSIPRGVVTTGRGAPDFTLYTAFMNQQTGAYFLNTHANQQIYTASLRGGRTAPSDGTPTDLGSILRPAEFLPLVP